MPDYYHVPALILTMLLLPAFEYLYLRYRDTRTLLWFLGFLFAVVAMFMPYAAEPSIFSAKVYPWLAAAGQTAIQISSALFLGSLSPLRFRIGRLNILYVIPYTIPLVIYSAIFYGVFQGISQAGRCFSSSPHWARSLSWLLVFGALLKEVSPCGSALPPYLHWVAWRSGFASRKDRHGR